MNGKKNPHLQVENLLEEADRSSFYPFSGKNLCLGDVRELNLLTSLKKEPPLLDY